MTGELISLFEQTTQPASQAATGQPAGIELPAPAGWPEPPDDDAFHGLPGQVVAKIAPNTEADPVAILTQLLVACGALIGRGAWFGVEATRHHPNQFLLLIGDSSRARKGSSLDHVTRLLSEIEPTFPSRLTTGLSSGEGLVWKVRDPSGQDPGEPDKRLLVIEPEFASVLKSTSREMSTLSPTLRSAWDGRPLALLTRTAPARATDAHVSIIGHITQTELRRHTTTVEIANGFMNRFVLVSVRRVRLLPEGGNPNPLKNTGLARYLATVLKHAQTTGQLKLDDAARELWWHTYPQLTQPGDGHTRDLTARAEAHVIRLALIYTLLDGERRIQPQHLHAALALWDYAARSATWALDQATGDPLAEHIHAALARSPDGLTRTQIRDLCQRNLPADRVEQALHALAAAGRAQQQRTLTGGRPAELWTTATAPGA
jgi:Protein of unknown function (DUF3987)